MDELLRLAYGELRGMAQALMRRERAGHTLDPTALVHEAWLRLDAQRTAGFAHRAEFFGAAATTMRRILVDHARARTRLKRGGGGADGLERVLDGLVAGFEDRAGELLTLDEALTELARIDARLARLVELRFFAGLEMHAVAALLSISPRQAARDWTHARAWLRHRLDGGQAEDEG